MIIELLHKISDHGDVLLSKFVYQFGIWVGVVGGAATYTTKKLVEPESSDPVVQFALNYGGLVSMIAGTMLVIKTCYDIYLNYRDEKRKQQKEKRERELHDKAMKDADS